MPKKSRFAWILLRFLKEILFTTLIITVFGNGRFFYHCLLHTVISTKPVRHFIAIQFNIHRTLWQRFNAMRPISVIVVKRRRNIIFSNKIKFMICAKEVKLKKKFFLIILSTSMNKIRFYLFNLIKWSNHFLPFF